MGRYASPEFDEAKIVARNARWSIQQMLRVAKGRPPFRTLHAQWDQGARRVRAPTLTPDPILDLYVARQNYRNRKPDCERAGTYYGEIRQRVISPVCLPPDSRWLELPAVLRRMA